MRTRRLHDRAVMTLSLCTVLFVLIVISTWLVPTVLDTLDHFTALTEGSK